MDERGNRTEFRYDAARQQIEEIFPELSDEPGVQYSNSFDYDLAGKQTRITDALGRTMTSVFDAVGRLAEMVYPDGTKTVSTYDALGLRVSEMDQNGKVKDYDYDPLGRLVAVIQYLDQDSESPTELLTEYEYDELGRLTLIRDANQHETSHEYDLVGRRTATVLPEGQRSDTTYDEVGNVETLTDFNRKVQSHSFDERDRLIRKDFEDSNSEIYTYTPIGQRQTVTDERGLTTYTYDTRDRLVARQDPNGPYTDQGNTIEYGYDPASNRTSVTTPSGTVTYAYDEWNRMSRVTDRDNQQTVYHYDGVSNLKKTELPNQVVESRDYDLLDRLLFIENRLVDTVLSSYQYELDPMGQRQSVEEQDIRRVEYDYDDIYRLIQEKITDPGDSVNDGRIIRYSYDPVGNRKQRDDSLEGTTTYTYDDNDRLLTEETELGGDLIEAITYSYDDNGNITGKERTAGDETEITGYGWNDENHLISADLPTGEHVDYEYDVNGIRMTSEVDGVRVSYLVDPLFEKMGMGTLAQVLEESGSDARTYVYGQGLISQTQGNDHFVYHTDGLGSIRLLTNEVGALENRYTYDAFGNRILAIETRSNSYQFAGEQLDQALGQYYLRARYYDPGMGRFTQRDSYEGMPMEPITRHDYIYANQNPVNQIDSLGRFATLADIAAARKIRDELAKLQRDSGLDLIRSINDPTAEKFTDFVEGAFVILDLISFTRSFSRPLTQLIDCQCFAKGTTVLTPDGEKAIEKILPGDYVLVGDPIIPGQGQVEKVLGTFAREVNSIIELTVEDQVVVTTEEHPFWVAEHGWRKAQDLKVGDRLQTQTQNDVILKGKRSLSEKHRVFNLDVGYPDTFYVSDLNILVHNGCRLPKRLRARLTKIRSWSKNPGGLTSITGIFTPNDAELLGKEFVGPNAREVIENGQQILISEDRLRQFRYPRQKVGIDRRTGLPWSSTGYQANFQSRSQPTGKWESNVHIDVTMP